MLISLICLFSLNVSGNKVSVIFSTAEILLLFPCLFLCLKRFRFSFHRLAEWGKIHLIFGLKSIPGGMISVLNTRVDILLLGYFLPDGQVGQYSLAAMIIEGILQLPFVFRRNLDPIITRLYVLKEHEKLQQMIRKLTAATFMGMLLIGMMSALLLPAAIKMFIGGASFTESYRLFIILMAGTVIIGTYLPASGILVQTGFPGYQTIFFLLCFITNVVLNGGMIVLWGTVGSAAATSISFGLSALYLKWFSRKYTSVRL
jgi:O-antigen/teichoic acid export membrane protein